MVHDMRYVSLIAVVFFSFTLAGCGEKEANEANKKANDAGKTDITLKLAHASEDAGDFASAERYYKEAADKSKDVNPRLELAQFYRRHSGERLALNVLNAAAKLYPQNTDIMRMRANVYIDMKRPEDAVKMADDALAITSNDAFLYNTKGVALDMLGKYTQARNSYSTALELDPDDAMTFNANIAMSYISTEYYSKAISLLLPLAGLPNATPQIRQNLALAYGLKGDNENALKWASKDLPEKQAAENVKFYNMLAQKGGVKTGDKTVPSKVDSIPPIP